MAEAVTSSLAERVAATRWYHTLDLPGGVVTPGHFDCRRIVHKLPLPASLEGRRCLDVGTWDGFWAFEMERRGANEVLAIDVDEADQWDWPADPDGSQAGGRAYLSHVKDGHRGFSVAGEALGSRVQRRALSVYDLDPDDVGLFDLVFLGSLLLHLRDPVRALDRLRSVCRGRALIADTVEAVPSYLRPRTPMARLEGLEEPRWWQPNRACLHRMVEAAGWTILSRTPVYFLPVGRGHPAMARFGGLLRAVRTPAGRERVFVRFLGVPHAAVLAAPRV